MHLAHGIANIWPKRHPEHPFAEPRLAARELGRDRMFGAGSRVWSCLFVALAVGIKSEI